MLGWFKLFEIVSDRKEFMDSGVLSSETTTICLWIHASSHVFDTCNCDRDLVQNLKSHCFNETV